MEALGLGAPQSNAACSSIEDLQGQLHQLLIANTTDTRAQHLSPSFEFLPYTTLHLPADSENSTAENPASDAAEGQQQPPIGRTVVASETVQNQPTDDPVLQKAVAKHITNAIGVVDRCAWTVRQVTRGAQGWQFTYICKDSLQAWNRANAKNPVRPVIGSYSGSGGLDPINLSRPAFDCRGMLAISFSKSSRSIVVKYEHTPFHTTVSQLVDRLVPAPIPAPAVNNSNQRTPKVKRPPVEGQEGSTKKRAPRPKRPAPAEGEDGQGSKKRRRKTATTSAIDPSAPGESQNTPQGQPQPSTVTDKTNLPGFLNVPPAEAERRRQTAIELLNGRGIDPSTLSPEQFSIFANQAPNLQSASLDMLAKYGAERLRIVHPDEKESSGTPNSTPVQATDALPTDTPQTSGDIETPSKKPRSRKKKSNGPLTEVHIGNGAVVPLEQDGGLGTTESALKPKAGRVRKTRGRCDTCRERNVTCTKEHPSCSVCVEAGVNCVYLPPKPRRKSQKSAEVVIEDEDEPNPIEGNHDVRQETESRVPVGPESSEPHTTIAPQPPDIENEEFIPDPNILSGPAESHVTTTQPVGNTTNYYQHAQEAVSFPQVSNSHATAGSNPIPNFTYPQAQTNEHAQQPSSDVVFPPSSAELQNCHGLPISESVPVSAPSERAQPTTSNRRSLPTGHTRQTPIPPPMIPAQTPHWGTSPPIHHATSASPKSKHQQTAKRSKPRKAAAELEQQQHPQHPQQHQQQLPQQPQQVHDGLKQVASQPVQYQSPMTRSPYQSAAQPRQGHRSKTSTPVATNARPAPQASSAATHTPVTSAASYNPPAASSSIPHYDPYPRYNHSNGNEQYTNAGNDHASSRATFNSNSYQVNATTTAPSSYSSIPSYDYGRNAGTSNPLSQALNSTVAYGGSTASNQWSTPQARDTQTNNNTSAYPLPVSSASASHSYSARAPDPRATNQNTQYGQPQSQSYNSYPQQQQQPALNQQGQPSWYRFPNTNSSNQANYTSNRQTSHGTHRSNAPAYSSQYSGGEEQAIYDMLRNGQSNH